MSLTHPESSSSPVASPARDAGSVPARILVVDDDLGSIGFLARLLKDEGYEVYVATGGEDALRLMRHNRPDLVILDVLMPDLDGYEVLEEARRIEGYADVPFIFISGVEDEGGVVAAFEAGACDYIAKPIRGAEFLARVRSHVPRRP